MTNPTPLSPAAQAIMDAFRTSHTGQGCLAAAILAAADHLPDHQMSAHMLYAIADELDGTSTPSEND